jgi:hypothetical protein
MSSAERTVGVLMAVGCGAMFGLDIARGEVAVALVWAVAALAWALAAARPEP